MFVFKMQIPSVEPYILYMSYTFTRVLDLLYNYLKHREQF